MDHFKKINDTHGHLAGDSVLVEFSNIAMNECRGEDIVARYGGEEFMIILIGAKVENAISVAERLRKIVEDYNFKGMSEPVTVSIGVAEFYGNKEIDDLIQQADKNLYTAKNKGRNRVE